MPQNPKTLKPGGRSQPLRKKPPPSPRRQAQAFSAYFGMPRQPGARGVLYACRDKYGFRTIVVQILWGFFVELGAFEVLGFSAWGWTAGSE